MKNCRLFKTTLSSAAACLAILLTGCGNVWTGGNLTPTDYSFDGTEGIATAAKGTATNMHETANYATIKVGDSAAFFSNRSTSPVASFGKAEENTELTVTIKSYSQLNEESVANAFKFYTLTDNTTDSSFAPKRSENALPSSLIDITSTKSSGTAASRNVTTVAEFKINTSSVETNRIAILADATILKDINGAAVLNANQNEVCGEATDSLVRYIEVVNKSDDTPTTALGFAYGEDFCPKLVYATALDVSVIDNHDGTYTVRSGSASYYDYSLTTPELKEKNDLASNLSSLWKIQTREDGASAWIMSDLSFTYDSTSQKYESQDITLAPGAKYRLVKYVPASENGLSESTQSILRYGHEAKQSYTRAYIDYLTTGSGTATYFTNEPSYIITTGSFVQGGYSASAIETVQKNLLTVTEKDHGKFDVALGTLNSEQLEYDLYSDFILTDAKLNRIPCTTKLKNKTTAIVEADNSFYTGRIYLWIGNGTSIKTNPVDGNNQTRFGIFKDSANGVASGYIKIYDQEP